MAENNAPQNMQDDDLSVEELESVSGGTGSLGSELDRDADITNNGCPTNGNCVPGCGG
jgi:hypothetical protein